MANMAVRMDLCAHYGLQPDCDPCAEFAWYGDRVCDANLVRLGVCEGPDPDCGPFVELRSFRLSHSAPCSVDVDCDGFIELWSDGSLFVDNTGELPSVVRAFKVTPEELERATPVLSDPALVALLELDEPPCAQPADLLEVMEHTEPDGTVRRNRVAFCFDAPLERARGVLRELADPARRGERWRHIMRFEH